jgi:hypothetical protein
MFERIRTVLVRSFIGTIVIGTLIAQSVFQLANAVTWPLLRWFEALNQRQPMAGSVMNPQPLPHLDLLLGFPHLLSAVLQLLVAWALLHWLYLRPEPGEGENS